MAFKKPVLAKSKPIMYKTPRHKKNISAAERRKLIETQTEEFLKNGGKIDRVTGSNVDATKGKPHGYNPYPVREDDRKTTEE